MAREAIGIDVGGTKTAAVRISADGKVLDDWRAPTPAKDPGATLETIVEAAGHMLTSDVSAIGVSAAGLVDSDEGSVLYAPNLAWQNQPLAGRVQEAFGLPVAVENDATSGAWAEYVLGAGRGYRDMLFAAVGTGLGGGIVLGGVLMRGSHGLAGEIGHFVVDPDGEICACGVRGCLETVTSGTAISKAGRRATRNHPHSKLRELAKGDPDAVTGPMVSDAAREGDPCARGILVEAGHRLGQGLAGFVNVLDPEVVVIGGGVAESAGDLLMDPVRAAFIRTVEGFGQRPEIPIVLAQLGNDAGAIGAAMIALEGSAA